jgi:hypothetical protein
MLFNTSSTKRIYSKKPGPLAVAYGQGDDSTAMLIGLVARRIRPDLILFANTGGERPYTYQYRKIINRFLEKNDFPLVTEVVYTPKNFKNYPPYGSLEENCLTNGTLPSISFGGPSKGACSMKWKQQPQHSFIKNWMPAIECWARGERVVKAIGFDNGPRDIRRANHEGQEEDPQYVYWYPLQEWGWDRERCVAEIRKAGLPPPGKSSCFFCLAMQPDEVRDLNKDQLRRIVVMEARAKPRLRVIEGLWGRSTKKRPGSMTVFIRQEGLLDGDEIDRIIATVPQEIIANQEAFKDGMEIPTWPEFFDKLPALCGGIEEE